MEKTGFKTDEMPLSEFGKSSFWKNAGVKKGYALLCHCLKRLQGIFCCFTKVHFQKINKTQKASVVKFVIFEFGKIANLEKTMIQKLEYSPEQ